MKIAWALILTLVSCQNSEGTKIFADFDKEHKEAELACREYEENFIKKSFTDNGPDEMPYQFIKGEKNALKAIDGYKLDLLDHSRAIKFQTLVYKHCEKDGNSGGIHYYCPDSITHHQFFKSLVSSMKIEKWSESTRKKGLDLTMKYLHKENDQPQALVTRAFMLNLLKTMTPNNQAIETAIADLDIEMEKIQKNLRNAKECESMSASFHQEMKVSEVYRTRIQKILESI